MKQRVKVRQRDPERAQIQVRGVVAPSEWNARDEVTAVTIYAHDETEYMVTSKPVVKRLLEHVDEEVQAFGFLSEDEYGEEVLIVADFTALEKDPDDEDDWDDDDWENVNWDDDDEDGDDEDDWTRDDDDWEDDDKDAPRRKRYRYR